MHFLVGNLILIMENSFTKLTETFIVAICSDIESHLF